MTYYVEKKEGFGERGEGKEVLLARKTRHIGKGRWNGYGGGLEPGENLLTCAVRETRQESGLEVSSTDLEKVAEVTFHNTKSDGRNFSCLVHVYIISRWRGEPRASEEMMEPTWFPLANLPVSQMMPADSIWLPLILAGKKIIGTAHYGPFQRSLLRPVEITEVGRFER